MRTLIESLLSLVEKKIVAPEEVYVKATDKEALSKALAAASFR